MSTFVSVGNCHQSFARMLARIAEMADGSTMPHPVYVQHGHTPFSGVGCVATPFLTRDEFDARLADASLVLVHGGATALQAVRNGKVPVVMPRQARYGEHIDDHQREFARSLATEGLAVVAEEPDDLSAAIASALAAQAARAGTRKTGEQPPLVRLIAEALTQWDTARTRRAKNGK
jgi:UDP-N-acetylglucosamine transferase subunit ALG13